MHRPTSQALPTRRRRGRSPRLELLEARALLATLTVNTTADEDSRDGTLSLREAIEVVDGTLGFGALSPPEQAQVVATPGVNVIDFDIPGGLASYRIAPTTDLPAITAPTIVDGTSQPGYAGKPIIELNGSQDPVAGVATNGLVLTAGRSTVHGLVIDQFQYLIAISGGGGDVIRGNYLGTDATGGVAAAVTGTSAGISIVGSNGNTIGGTTAADRNVISGIFVGVSVGSAVSDPIPSYQGATGTVIRGNYLGTDAAGTKAISDYSAAIQLNDVSGNTIGGTAPGAGNLISGNNTAIDFEGGSGNLVQGNHIGTDASGRNPLPNQIAVNFSGLSASTGLSGGTIGGTTPGSGNVIAYNQQAGIVVGDDPAAGPSGLTIERNSIYDNANLGISIGGLGIDSNTPGTRHQGADDLLNYPVIHSAAVAAGGTAVAGSFESSPGATYRIEFFTSPSAGPEGFGEGQTLFGVALVTTDSAGHATFTTALAGDLSGKYITATATDAAGFTSAFSRAFRVGAPALAATAITLTTAPDPSLSRNGFTVTATVVAPGGGTPTGVVALSVNGVPMYGTAPVVTTGGKSRATFTLPSYSPGYGGVAPGQYTLAATYQGDATFAPSSTSKAVVHTVSEGINTTIRYTVSPNPPIAGRPVTLTAVVLPAPAGPTPTGSVEFFISGPGQVDVTVPLTVVGGVATASYTASGLVAGAHYSGASYAGQGAFNPSVSSTLNFTVAPAPAQPPRVTGLHRVGSGSTLNRLVLDFSGPLEVPHAQDVSNYVLTGPLDRTGGTGPAVAIVAAVYDAATQTVTLTTAQPLVASRFALYSLKVRGGIGGLRGTTGLRLAGSGGTPGTSYYGSFRGAGPVGA